MVAYLIFHSSSHHKLPEARGNRSAAPAITKPIKAGQNHRTRGTAGRNSGAATSLEAAGCHQRIVNRAPKITSNAARVERCVPRTAASSHLKDKLSPARAAIHRSFALASVLEVTTAPRRSHTSRASPVNKTAVPREGNHRLMAPYGWSAECAGEEVSGMQASGKTDHVLQKLTPQIKIPTP